MTRKGLLIVAIATAFQLAFLFLAFAIQRAHDRDLVAEIRVGETEAATYRLLSLLVDAETAMRGFMLTGNDAFLGPLRHSMRETPVELADLRGRVGASREFDEVADRAAATLAFHVENLDLVRKGSFQTALDRIRLGIGRARMDAFRASLQSLLAAEHRAVGENRRRMEVRRRRLNAAMVAGVTANLAISMSLLFFFGRHFRGRLGAVIENTRRIERGEPLPAPLQQHDEIADLDRRVHDMASALESAKSELNHFFDVSVDMLAIANVDGFFKRVNPAFEKTLGWSGEEMCARPWIDFVHPDDRQATIDEGQQLQMGIATIEFQNRYRCADGTYRWLLWRAAPDVETGLIYAAASDITNRKDLEQSLHAQNEALRAANHSLESFSYSVSHDLRAPLRAVDGYARILEEDYGAKLDEEALRYIAVVRSEAHRMGALIDDLLTFSRLDRQAVVLVATDLHALAREVLADVRINCSRPIEFICEGALPAMADPRMVRQVLINLISNAVKYAKPDGTIRIEFAASADGDRNVYSVRDNGIGFDARYAEKIFGVFQRLHNDEQYEGTGVGLAIVERVIARHGGRVWATSTPGEGSTFFFTLPAVEERAA